MNLMRWTAVAGMLVATGACNDAIGPTASTLIGNSVVRLTVSRSSAEVERGSLVTFSVSLVNEGSEEVTLTFGDSCQIIPTIQNAGGEIVVPEGGAWGCLTVITQLTLLPGQPVVREYVWTGGTEFLAELRLSPLPPGQYFFTAEVPQGEATLRATTQVTLK